MFLLIFVTVFAATALSEDQPVLRVGAKSFTESVILGELVGHLARDAGSRVDDVEILGGSDVVFQALQLGEIDIYADYTGTLRQELLAKLRLQTDQDLRDELANREIVMSKPLGFENTYALGMLADEAEELGITKISELTEFPDLRFGFGHEFLERDDGWPAMRRAYQLPHKNIIALEHDLAYTALSDHGIDLMDVYTTDAKIDLFGLTTLEDDYSFFPQYKAVLLYRRDLETRMPDVLQNVLRLEGAISVDDMIAMNAAVEPAEGEGVTESRSAAQFAARKFAINAQVTDSTMFGRLWKTTWEHLLLVSVSASMAILVAIPLGVMAAKIPSFGHLILGFVGLLQTIPSLALLVLFIPILKTGPAPAIAALFLYSLLPIVRNTHAGLTGIPLSLRESAEALGLSAFDRLRFVELPLALPAILAGIKTAIVINVGTATLGGFIGAGGYGATIFSGLRKADNALLLEGAVPAAVMALVAQLLFDLIERLVVSPGLRQQSR
ncbi:glycine betaine ABC transporter substrate-binding protein [Calycomorphotria hydatis]|nr:glycine betaine ABC transporter substrate-binding protein [Calycomorphotria hydatis]